MFQVVETNGLALAWQGPMDDNVSEQRLLLLPYNAHRVQNELVPRGQDNGGQLGKLGNDPDPISMTGLLGLAQQPVPLHCLLNGQWRA